MLKIIARKVLEVIAKTGDDRLKKVKKLKDIQAAVDIMMYVADDALDEFYEIIQIIFEPVKNIRDNQGAVDYENMAMSKDAIEWDIDSKMMRDIFVAFIDQNKALGEVLKNMNALRIL